MSKNSEVNVALLGYGYVGKTFHAPLIQSVDGLRLHTILSSDREKVHRDLPDVAVTGDFDLILQDQSIDVVVVATPNQTHHDLARRALEAGKAVVVDKPFTITYEEAKDLVDLAQRQKLMLSVFHNRRWDGDFLTLKRIVADDTIGEVTHFESHFDRYRPVIQQRWRESAERGGGLWFDLGPHLLDQALQLFGKPDALLADFALQRDAAKAVDYAHVVLRYGERRVVLHASTLVAETDPPRFIVHGKRGSFIKHGLDMQESALKEGKRPQDGNWGTDMQAAQLTTCGADQQCSTSKVSMEPGDYPAYYRAVRDAVRLGVPHPVTPEQCLDVMALLEVAMKSAQQRRELQYRPEQSVA